MRTEAPLDITVRLIISKIGQVPDELSEEQLEAWRKIQRGEAMERFMKGFGDLLVGLAGLSVRGSLDFSGVTFLIGGGVREPANEMTMTQKAPTNG